MIDAESLRVLKHVRGAHMTFATSVAFSPDEQFIISGRGPFEMGDRQPAASRLHASSTSESRAALPCWQHAPSLHSPSPCTLTPPASSPPLPQAPRMLRRC